MNDIFQRTRGIYAEKLGEANEKLADVLIRPDIKGIKFLDATKIDEAIERGREAALKALPRIKKLFKYK